MSYFVVALADWHMDAPQFWCGYVAEGKTHRWERNAENAVRFLRRTDAVQSGVSGPNVPNCPADQQPQFQPDRGVKIVKIPAG